MFPPLTRTLNATKSLDQKYSHQTPQVYSATAMKETPTSFGHTKFNDDSTVVGRQPESCNDPVHLSRQIRAQIESSKGSMATLLQSACKPQEGIQSVSEFHDSLIRTASELCELIESWNSLDTATFHKKVRTIGEQPRPKIQIEPSTAAVRPIEESIQNLDGHVRKTNSADIPHVSLKRIIDIAAYCEAAANEIILRAALYENPSNDNPILHSHLRILHYPSRDPRFMNQVLHCLNYDLVTQGETKEEGLNDLEASVEFWINDFRNEQYRHPYLPPLKYHRHFLTAEPIDVEFLGKNKTIRTMSSPILPE